MTLPPNPHQNEELRELIEEGLHFSLCDFEPQRENTHRCAICNETKWDVHHSALSFIAQYGDKRELEGRIDELNRVEPRGDDRPLVWTTGNDPELAITIDERLTELTNNKESQ